MGKAYVFGVMTLASSSMWHTTIINNHSALCNSVCHNTNIKLPPPLNVSDLLNLLGSIKNCSITWL